MKGILPLALLAAVAASNAEASSCEASYAGGAACLGGGQMAFAYSNYRLPCVGLAAS
jgi:hypothetical protein